MTATVLNINPLRPIREYPKHLLVSANIINELRRIHTDSRYDAGPAGSVLVERSGIITKGGTVLALPKDEQVAMLVAQKVNPMGSSPRVEERIKAFVDQKKMLAGEAEISFHTHPGSQAPSNPDASTHGPGDVGITAMYASERPRLTGAYHKNIVVALHAIYFMISTLETKRAGVDRRNYRKFRPFNQPTTGWTMVERIEAQSMSWVGAYQMMGYKYNPENKQFDAVMIP